MYYKRAYLIILILYGCGFSTVIGKNLDYFIKEKVSKEFNLDEKQKELLKSDLKIFLNENKESFSRINKNLLELRENIINPNLDYDIWEKSILSLHHSYQEITSLIVAALTNLLTSLDKEQKKILYKKWKEENEKIEKQLKKNKIKTYLKKFEDILGELTQQQIDIIKKYDQFFQTRNKTRLKKRKIVQNELQKQLSKNPINKKEISKALRISLSESFSSEEIKTLSKLSFELKEVTKKDNLTKLIDKISKAIEIVDIVIKTSY